MGWFCDEAFGVCGVGGIQGVLSQRQGVVGMSEVDRSRGEQGDAGVAVVVVVPSEKILAKGSGVLKRAEALGELRGVFQGLEVRLGVGIVGAGVRSGMGFGDSQVGQEKGHGFGAHRGAAIGMDGELSGSNVLFEGRVLDEASCQDGAFAGSQHPSDDTSAEDIEDDVEVEVGPLGGSQEFGDVPGPDLVGGPSVPTWVRQ